MPTGATMHRGARLALAAVLGLFVYRPGQAQEKPLRVEIATATPHQRDPILVHVTNLTSKTIELAFPLYSYARSYQAAPSDPSALPSRIPRPSPQIAPGETREYEFSVVGAGEYRVRVWYAVSPPDPRLPPNAAEQRSVVSAPVHVK
jgi:hypothetical protein